MSHTTLENPQTRPGQPAPARFVYSHIRLRILDPAGCLVRELQDGWIPARPQQLRWDGRDRNGTRVNSGVYFVAVDAAGGVREGGKLAILR